MKAERTAGKLRVLFEDGSIFLKRENGLYVAEIQGYVNKDEATDICKAVNNHERLVEALKAFVKAWDKSHQLEKTDRALRLARKALAELEEKKP